MILRAKSDKTNAKQNIAEEKNILPDALVSKISSFFKALGDDTRVKIIYALSINEMCVTGISELLEMSQSAISHQLKQLKLEGHVKSRRDGKNIFYSLDDDHVADILGKTLSHVQHKIEDAR